MQFRENIFYPLRKIIQKFRGASYGWYGDYINWHEAKKKCLGYDASSILDKIKIATSKVKSGEAKYERDSILFSDVEYSWPLLSALMWVSSMQKGRISTLDFGGSLGSSYFQNKKFLLVP